MIRVVVVDDDFRIAGIHAAYVDKVDGFQAIAQAHTASEAFAFTPPALPAVPANVVTEPNVVIFRIK